jgi:hypothetical protein
MTIKSIFVIVAMAIAVAASASTALARQDALSVARAGTAAFHDVDSVQAAGYGEFRDAAGIACIDNPGAGGMGVHFASLGQVLDPAVDAANPEALVYEPESNGRLRLVAAEYIVFQAAWDAVNSSPPALFGHEFELNGSPNRYGLPPFYELHAWIWKHNPRGMFDDWNPRVSCASAQSSASVARVRSAAAPIQWTAAQLKGLADAYSAKNPGWQVPSGSLAENRTAAQITWTSENLDALASAYAALNPGWTRP